MRALKKEELKAVSGGFFLFGGLLRHLFAAGFGQYAGTQVDVVLQTDPGIAAHRQRGGHHREL